MDKRMTAKKLIIPAIAVLAVLGAFIIYAAQPPASHAAAPNFTLTDVNGHTFSLSDFHGKIVLLQIFATW